MEKENTAEVLKLTLYDRVFKPQRIVLENGYSAAACGGGISFA